MSTTSHVTRPVALASRKPEPWVTGEVARKMLGKMIDGKHQPMSVRQLQRLVSDGRIVARMGKGARDRPERTYDPESIRAYVNGGSTALARPFPDPSPEAFLAAGLPFPGRLKLPPGLGPVYIPFAAFVALSGLPEHIVFAAIEYQQIRAFEDETHVFLCHRDDVHAIDPREWRP